MLRPYGSTKMCILLLSCFFKSHQSLKAEMSKIKLESLLAWKVFDHTFARDYVFLDHPQSGMVYNFGQFCLSVCTTAVQLHVGTSHDNFWQTSCRNAVHICTSRVSSGNMDQVHIWRSSGQGQGQGHRTEKGPQQVNTQWTPACIHFRAC